MALGLASAGRGVACSDFADLEAFDSDIGSVRTAFSRAAVLGSADRVLACSDFAGLESFGSDIGSLRAAFSCAAVLGSADRAVACSDFARLDDALSSVLGSVFAVSSWATGAGVLVECTDLACSVAAPLDRLAAALSAFPLFAFPRFAAVFV